MEWFHAMDDRLFVAVAIVLVFFAIVLDEVLATRERHRSAKSPKDEV